MSSPSLASAAIRSPSAEASSDAISTSPRPIRMLSCQKCQRSFNVCDYPRVTFMCGHRGTLFPNFMCESCNNHDRQDFECSPCSLAAGRLPHPFHAVKYDGDSH